MLCNHIPSIIYIICNCYGKKTWSIYSILWKSPENRWMTPSPMWRVVWCKRRQHRKQNKSSTKKIWRIWWFDGIKSIKGYMHGLLGIGSTGYNIVLSNIYTIISPPKRTNPKGLLSFSPLLQLLPQPPKQPKTRENLPHPDIAPFFHDQPSYPTIAATWPTTFLMTDGGVVETVVDPFGEKRWVFRVAKQKTWDDSRRRRKTTCTYIHTNYWNNKMYLMTWHDDRILSNKQRWSIESKTTTSFRSSDIYRKPKKPLFSWRTFIHPKTTMTLKNDGLKIGISFSKGLNQVPMLVFGCFELILRLFKDQGSEDEDMEVANRMKLQPFQIHEKKRPSNPRGVSRRPRLHVCFIWWLLGLTESGIRNVSELAETYYLPLVDRHIVNKLHVPEGVQIWDEGQTAL